ncbi:MAG: DUF2252 domain-containing protein [Cytophagaceae bacterium]
MKTVAERIELFNRNRIPELVKIKFRNMSKDPFRFYRGTAHLFYESLAAASDPFPASPSSWICGDLHLENFGSYKADNREPYFDINDFDEGCLAPALWEISRLLCSILIAKDFLQVSHSEAKELCADFIRHYTSTLRKREAGFVHEESSEGIIRELLDERKSRKRKAFLSSRTRQGKENRKLLIDDKKVSKTPGDRKEELEKIVSAWASKGKDPEFYKVLDIGYRIAGTASMGLERYVLLLEGLGSPDDNYLLDLKMAKPSCLHGHVKTRQPDWKNEAERIMRIQKKMQAFPLALLNTLQIGKQWFVIKELQPTQDKVDLEACKGKMPKLDVFIKTIAEITAWAQLRSSDSQGSASPEAMGSFASDKTWEKPLMDYVKEYADQVQSDYKEYVKAYKKGAFDR